jgi:hypothetical protein
MFINVIWSRRAIGRVRLVTAVLGFMGTILVIKPFVGGLNWANLIPASAGLIYVFGNVATRKWCEGESAVALLWSYMFLILIFGSLGVAYLYFNPGDLSSYLTRGWVWPSAGVWVWIWWQAVLSFVGIGLIIVTGIIISIRSKTNACCTAITALN